MLATSMLVNGKKLLNAQCSTMTPPRARSDARSPARSRALSCGGTTWSVIASRDDPPTLLFAATFLAVPVLFVSTEQTSPAHAETCKAHAEQHERAGLRSTSDVRNIVVCRRPCRCRLRHERSPTSTGSFGIRAARAAQDNQPRMRQERALYEICTRSQARKVPLPVPVIVVVRLSRERGNETPARGRGRWNLVCCQECGASNLS
jgi:hypothetical protein